MSLTQLISFETLNCNLYVFKITNYFLFCNQRKFQYNQRILYPQKSRLRRKFIQQELIKHKYTICSCVRSINHLYFCWFAGVIYAESWPWVGALYIPLVLPPSSSPETDQTKKENVFSTHNNYRMAVLHFYTWKKKNYFFKFWNGIASFHWKLIFPKLPYSEPRLFLFNGKNM